MKYATAVAVFAAGAAASYYPVAPPAYNGTVWVTTTVDSYTTVCPSATSFAHGGVTYTATASETITVTNCPCTVSYPVTTATTSTCVTCTSSVAVVPPPSSTPESPVKPSSPSTPNFPVPGNGTVPVQVQPSAPSAAPTKTSPVTSPFTGAANKAFAASGASFAAVFGLVAYAL